MMQRAENFFIMRRKPVEVSYESQETGQEERLILHAFLPSKHV